MPTIPTTTTTTFIPRTYEPFIQTHGDGTDPWFVLWANQLIIMNKENRHRMVVFQKLINCVFVIFLTGLAGIASGLTLALFTLDPEKLKTLSAAGKGKKCDQARRVLPHLVDAHWTLVTLLVVNAFCVETMPLILSRLYGGLLAVVISVILTLFFGEIIPQAVFTRYALPICSFFSPFLTSIKFITSPISFPVGKLLDYVIGHRQRKFMRRVELQQLIKLHQTEEKQKRHEERDAALIEATLNNLSPHEMLENTSVSPTVSTSFRARQVGKRSRKGVKPGPRQQTFTTPRSDEDSSSSSSDSDHLEELEVRIMIGALSMSELTVRQIVKKTVDKIFCIAADRKIDRDVVERVFVSGFSRVLVLDEDEMRFIGYFLSRDLVAFAFKSEANAPLARDLHLHQPIYCSGDETVGSLYAMLCLVSTPIVIVTDAPASTADAHTVMGANGELAMDTSAMAMRYKPIGLVTFEDVFETVQGTSITDETDNDNEKSILLRSKLFEAMAMRRKNQRFTEALTKGMLRRELTSDLFATGGYASCDGACGADDHMPLAITAAAGGGDKSASEEEPLTSRTGLLPRQGEGVGSYGSTAARRSRATSSTSKAISPTVSFAHDTKDSTHNGVLARIGSDTFLSPRLRNAFHFPQQSSSVNLASDHSGGVSPKRR